eukprot:sb/3470880/
MVCANLLCAPSANAVLDSKVCNVLRQYLKENNTLRDLPVHVIYYILRYLLKENGMPASEREMVVAQLQQAFPVETCPVILVPLLHSSNKISITPDKVSSDCEPHNLSALMAECGYSCCESVDDLTNLFNLIKTEITPKTVAKTLGMMIKRRELNTDTMISLQNINSAMSWSDKAESTSTSWNLDNFIYVLKQKVR